MSKDAENIKSPISRAIKEYDIGLLIVKNRERQCLGQLLNFIVYKDDNVFPNMRNENIPKYTSWVPIISPWIPIVFPWVPMVFHHGSY